LISGISRPIHCHASSSRNFESPDSIVAAVDHFQRAEFLDVSTAVGSILNNRYRRVYFMGLGGISRHSRGDHPATEATIDFEVGVGGEKKWLGQDFREPDQTGVGDAHGNVGVFIQEVQDGDEGIHMERGNP
jgi:hypothetical protein